jgi:hypothetical protein
MEPHNLRPPTNPPMHPPTQTTNQATNQSINQPSNLLITLAPGSHHGAPLERPIKLGRDTKLEQPWHRAGMGPASEWHPAAWRSIGS